MKKEFLQEEIQYDIEDLKNEIRQKIKILKNTLQRIETKLDENATLNQLGEIQGIGTEIDTRIARLVTLQGMYEVIRKLDDEKKK